VKRRKKRDTALLDDVGKISTSTKERRVTLVVGKEGGGRGWGGGRDLFDLLVEGSGFRRRGTT